MMRLPRHRYYYYPLEQRLLLGVKANPRVAGIRLASANRAAALWLEHLAPIAVIKIPRQRLDRGQLELVEWADDVWHYLYSGVIDVTGCDITVWGAQVTPQDPDLQQHQQAGVAFTANP